MTTRGTFIGDTANNEAEEVSDSLKSHLTDSPVAQSQTLRDSVAIALNKYFSHLDGQPVTDVYQMVLSDADLTSIEFQGLVTELPLAVNVGDAIGLEATIKITDAIEIGSGGSESPA